ncbi:MAG: D-lyxose/D-mannose family sugar isomerase [Rhodobacterales bacterium]|nr:MAG: D-lyxose/D-mannose family sugar isomerase [Rhodobacterales bacterium]
MKRSEINAAIRSAEALIAEYRWRLPDWAGWSEADFAAEPELAAFLAARQLGWDVTDFGLGDFAATGLTLFCVRNGVQGDPATLPYAEKLLFVNEGQVTPFHSHKVKMEDIMVRGGGNLLVAFTREGSEADDPVRVDGRVIADPYAEPIRLAPGNGVTIPRGMKHSFWGEPGTGPAFCAEISQCNDDLTDNYFLKPIGRFSTIEEDEPKHRPLWNEHAARD